MKKLYENIKNEYKDLLQNGLLSEDQFDLKVKELDEKYQEIEEYSFYSAIFYVVFFSFLLYNIIRENIIIESQNIYFFIVVSFAVLVQNKLNIIFEYVKFKVSKYKIYALLINIFSFIERFFIIVIILVVLLFCFGVLVFSLLN